MGGFAALLPSGQPVEVSCKKNRALLTYLAFHADKKLTREKLINLLWSDRGEAQARSSLRQALAALRRDLGDVQPPPLTIDGDTVTLDGSAVSTDVAAFEELAASASVEELRRAANLYEGDLLDGLAVRDPAFDDWLAFERSRLREVAIGALTRLMAHLNAAEAITTGQRLVALDPLREASHQALMHAYAAQGQFEQAIRQHHYCRDTLRRELDVAPSAEIESPYREIREGRYLRQPAAASAEAGEPVPPLDERLPTSGPRQIAPARELVAPAPAHHRSIAVLALAGLLIVAVIVASAAAWLQPWRLLVRPSSGLPSPVAGGKPSLVVLPFENLSNNKQQEFFVDGLTEDLITDLSNLSGIFVISRNTAFTYKNQTTRPTQIAKDLGVTYVVNGSVRREAGRVRITAELIDALNDRQIWAQRYDRDLVDVFAVEDEVKKEIVQSLAVKLAPGEQRLVASAPTKSVEAYDYYLRGRRAMNATAPARLGLAFWAFEKAIALDPDFAEAYASLALTNVIDLTRETGSLSNTDSYGSPQSMRTRAVALAQKAASLKPSLSIPEIVSARLSIWDGRYDEAIEHARRAVEHEPGNVDAYLTQALC